MLYRHIFAIAFLASSFCIFPLDSLNILLIAPGWSSSLVLFHFRIAKTLSNRNHTVTIFMHMMTSGLRIEKPPRGVELIVYTPQFPDNVLERSSTTFKSLAFEESNFTHHNEVQKSFRRVMLETCEQVLNDHEMLDYLRSKNFDITLSHFFVGCPSGWSQRIGVTKFVWIATGAFIFENVAWKVNLPHVTSYMPSHLMKNAYDRMTFFQRLRNFLWSCMVLVQTADEKMSPLIGRNSEESIFRQPPYHTENDPYLSSLVEKTATILINGEPFLDFPKPLLAGMAHMGELEEKVVKKLPEDWQHLMDNADAGVIIFSFGTVANTSTMPFRLKEAFFKAFVKFPKYTIIWRLEGQLPKDLDKYSHIHLVSWFPQSDLLHHKNMKLFIMHGGYNSYLESTQAGVPMVLMPLLIDQYSNAERAKSKGLGLVLDKHEATAESIEYAISTVLNDPSFTKNARHLASILKDQIVPNQLAALYQIEKIARTGRLWPTMKAAQRLNMIQYFCLDIAAVLLATTALIVYTVLIFCYFIWNAVKG